LRQEGTGTSEQIENIEKEEAGQGAEEACAPLPACLPCAVACLPAGSSRACRTLACSLCLLVSRCVTAQIWCCVTPSSSGAGPFPSLSCFFNSPVHLRKERQLSREGARFLGEKTLLGSSIQGQRLQRLVGRLSRSGQGVVDAQKKFGAWTPRRRLLNHVCTFFLAICRHCAVGLGCDTRCYSLIYKIRHHQTSRL
jgi:hypothetical protein